MNRRLLALLLLSVVSTKAGEALPDSPLLAPATPEQRSIDMVAGINRWLHREAERQTADRHARWEAAAKSGAWDKFVADQAAELSKALESEGAKSASLPIAKPQLEVTPEGHIRWSVFEDVDGEGIVLRPPGEPAARVVVVPDASETPENCALARRFAARGCEVWVPVLVNRESTFSGNPAIRMTNQPHREWIERQAFEMGETMLGYEAAKVAALLEALNARPDRQGVFLAGDGDGGAIALRAAASRPVRGVLLSGSFATHRAYELEPIDRNVFGAWRNFGDAELAALISSGTRPPLVIELGQARDSGEPVPPAAGKKNVAAPGRTKTPAADDVAAEVAQLNRYRPGRPAIFDPTARTGGVDRLLEAGGIKLVETPVAPLGLEKLEAETRQKRAVRALERHTQALIAPAERSRFDQVWAKVETKEWPAVKAELQERLWSSIGKLPGEKLPPNPRTRRIIENSKWTAYEVMLDVQPDVSAWGWLLVPNDLEPGERRPVVVCQHGLEGLPGDTVAEDPQAGGFHFYQGFAARLAEEGFITYAPHNPYRGTNEFRQLQRQANPLGLSLFSFIVAQHEVTTDWLASLPFVDPARIAFYGLSYGGKTAMRVPALVDRYCLSICSGDFNEWIRKNVSTEERNSYMFTHEYEMPEWNLAWNASYAEMAMLIAPRPFMVERGHRDGVGTDEWVAYEYAKVKRGYLRLGIPEKTEIEWFDGPHTIHGQGTFAFLRKWLGPVR